jgi:TatD DNase family protein
MFIDTHCHLDDNKLIDTKSVVKDYLLSGVDIAINMGCNFKSSEVGRALSKEYPSIYFAVGFHPSDANDFNNDSIDKLRGLTLDNKCVAIGEIGLDYYWEPYDEIKQKECFISQIELAGECNLPICVHSRNATADMIKVLKENKEKLTNGGVIHCFSGSVETAREFLNLGFYISFAGPITFKNANALLDVAKFVPVDKCLTETDSPYLAPHPLRGTVNSPKNVPIITAKLASLKGIELTEFANVVMKNAKTLFRKLI